MSSIFTTIAKPIEQIFEIFFPEEIESEREVPANRDDMLASRVRRLQRKQEARRKKRKLYMLAGVLLLIVGPAMMKLFGNSYKSPSVILPMFYGLLFLSAALMISPRDLEGEIRQTEDELDLLRSADASTEQRAQKLFKLHQLELKKYYDQTLKQSKWIFLVGICCLVLGFAVIGMSLWFVFKTGEGDKKIIAWLGAIGGILSNFIAAVYLKMHSETIKSLTEFHNRLVLTHYLHFGNFLLAKIDNRKLREKSLAQVAINLSTNQKHSPKAGKDRSSRSSRRKKEQSYTGASLEI